MLRDEVQQVIDIARVVAREEIALALKDMEAAAVKPESAPINKEVKKHG
jgi:hypothetical protein